MYAMRASGILLLLCVMGCDRAPEAPPAKPAPATQPAPPQEAPQPRDASWAHTQAQTLVDAALGDETRASYEARNNNPLQRHGTYRAAMASLAQTPQGLATVARIYELAGALGVAAAIYTRLEDRAGLERVAVARAELDQQAQARIEAVARQKATAVGPDGKALPRVRLPGQDQPEPREVPRVEPAPDPEKLAEAKARRDAAAEVSLPLQWRDEAVTVLPELVDETRFGVSTGAVNLALDLTWSLERLGPFDRPPARYAASVYVPQPYSGNESLRFQQLRITMPWTARGGTVKAAHAALASGLCGQGQPVPEQTEKAPSLGDWKVEAMSGHAMRCAIWTACRGDVCVTLWLGGRGRAKMPEVAAKVLATPGDQP